MVQTSRSTAVPPGAGTDHEHAWRQRLVEFVEGGRVEELECAECGEVSFR